MDIIVEQTRLSKPVVNKWRQRFRQLGIDGLKDAPRSGKPRIITPEQQAIVIDTILIFASDNGGYWPQEEIDLHDHDSNWGRRGQKSDVLDGGHRIPLIISWPAGIDKPFHFNHLVSLTDFFATLADLADLEIDDNMGEDSFSFLSVLMGDKEKPVRPAMTHYSSRGMYSIRQGEWKFVDGLGSGGFTDPSIVDPQPGGPQGQLYRILTDSLESENLYMDNPNKVKSLQQILEVAKDKPDRMRIH